MNDLINGLFDVGLFAAVFYVLFLCFSIVIIGGVL
jgi:hypothetical protein